MVLKKLSGIFHSPTAHMGLLLFSVFFLIHLFYRHQYNIAFYDEPVTQLKMNKEFPRNKTIDVGLFILDFNTFDINKNEIASNCIVWFDFDKGISQEKIDQFFFTKGTIEKIEHKSVVERDGRMIATYNVKVNFKTPLDYRNFPIDDHRISFRVGNLNFDANEILMRTDVTNFNTHRVIYTHEWRPYNKAAMYGYEEVVLDKNDGSKTINFPKAIFSLELEKVSRVKLFIFFLPLFIIFLFGVFSLTLSLVKNPTLIFNLSIGSVSALIFYRPVIERDAPSTPYFTLCDKFFALLLLTGFTLVIVQMFLMHLMVHNKRLHLFSIPLDTVRMAIYWVVMFATVLACHLLFP